MPTLVRPGVNFQLGTAQPPAGLPSDTGVAFMAVASPLGPTSKPLLVTSVADFVAKYGARVSYSSSYDAVDAFFAEGGSRLWAIRFAGPAAAADSLILKDSLAGNSVTLTAVGPGAYGLSATVVAGASAGSYQIVITRTATTQVLEQTPDLFTPSDAVAWSVKSNYVLATASGANAPAVAAAAPLTGGTDDLANITDVQRVAALALFPADLGPGQVLVPGATTDVVRQGLVAHAQANNRMALLDYIDTPTASTLTGSALTIRTGITDPSYAMSFAPWLLIPGVVPNTNRVIPPSAVAAGLMARSDQSTGNPNTPAAGGAGECRYVLGVTQTYSDADRGTLNSGGIDVFRLRRTGSTTTGIRLYGYRTLADAVNHPDWANGGAARLRMSIQSDASIIGEDSMFAQLDGQGQTIAHFHGRLVDMLSRLWQRGALFGATPADAFQVDTSDAVNTLALLAQNTLSAVISIRPSPMVEMISFTLVPVPVTIPLAA